LATMRRNHGRNGAPGRKVPSFRYALMNASCAASSPALEPAMLAAVRRALSSWARTSSAYARSSPARARAIRTSSCALARAAIALDTR
jgi:hypothetical protein